MVCASATNHVLIVSHDQVGTLMAGPGVRYRGLARALAREFRVTLAVPSAGPDEGLARATGDLSPDHAGSGRHDLRGVAAVGLDYAWWPYSLSQWASLAPAVERAGVIVTAGDTLASFPELAQSRAPLVIDGYIPHLVETLALRSADPLPEQIAHYRARLAVVQQQCQLGDFFICASERQRDWWLGILESQGRVNPLTYAADPSLRRLVDVVPYGLDSVPPQAGEPAVRGVWPGVGIGDFILLWGGGLWQWLDPLTAVHAVARLVQISCEGQRLRLVFPGTRHPNPGMPDMSLRAQTMALSAERGLTGKHVFFGEWLPYHSWPTALLEADLGLSLHPNTVETRLSNRTRLLDYFWAGLPMVVTEGDSLSEIVRERGLGIVVGFEDDAAVAAAILKLLEQPRSAWQDRFAGVQATMTWERAVGPLVEFCREPHRADDRTSTVPGVRPSQLSGPGSPAIQAGLASAESDAEVARLKELVTAYERGRFIRFMRWLRAWRHKAIRS